MQKTLKAKKKISLSICGIFAGFMNGFFGGGGGMLIVPVLHFLGENDERTSHATAISIMLPLSIVSAVTYTLRGVSNLTYALYCGGGVVFGGIVGAFLLNKLPQKALAFIFYIIMIVAGVKMIV